MAKRSVGFLRDEKTTKIDIRVDLPNGKLSMTFEDDKAEALRRVIKEALEEDD